MQLENRALAAPSLCSPEGAGVPARRVQPSWKFQTQRSSQMEAPTGVAQAPS